MKVKDVQELLLWEKKHSRLFVVLADRMLESLPRTFKEDELLSETILKTRYEGVFSMTINFRDGVSNMVRDTLKQSELKLPEYKSFSERLEKLYNAAEAIQI